MNGEVYDNCIFTLLIVMAHFRMSIVWLCDLDIRPSDLETSPRVTRDIANMYVSFWFVFYVESEAHVGQTAQTDR